MSLRTVCFIPLADLQRPKWNKISRSVVNQNLLEPPLQYGFTHLLLRIRTDNSEIISGIGLTQESVPTADGQNIQVLRLGVPFGSLVANDLAPLFSFLIRYSCRAWFKSGFQPLYWWTAADHQVYSLIARFSMRFYPSRRHLMLSSISWLQEKLGRKHFGQSYSTYTGTISATEVGSSFTAHPTEEVAANWLDEVSPTQWDDPDYSYYLDINSGSIRGNTLLVLMPFNVTNILVMQLKISLSWLKEGLGWQTKAVRTGLTRFLPTFWRRQAQVDQLLSEEQRPA